MRGLFVLASAFVVAIGSSGASVKPRSVNEPLRLIALPPSRSAPSPQFMRVDAAGKNIIVGENGPHVWRWHNGLHTAVPRAEDIDPTGCGDVGGVDDVAVSGPAEFYTVNDCLAAGSGEFEWSSRATGPWNPDLHGIGRPIDLDNDGGFISTDLHNPGGLYFVSHTLGGPGGIAAAVIFRHSSDDGNTWGTPVYVNAPTNYPGTQRAEAIELDGPDLYTPAIVDPNNPRHLTIAWIAESEVDFAQDHADDSLDRYEWDTSAHVANSYDGGLTWQARTILDTGQHPPGTPHAAYNDIGGWQPSLAAGPHHTLYLAFTEMLAGTKVWQPRVMRSRDAGRTWSRSVALPHRGSAFATSVAVWRGELIAGWYSSATKDALDPHSTWRLQISRYRWPGSGSPRLLALVHTPVLHVGVGQPINNSSGQDPLHDTVDLAVEGNYLLTPVVIGDVKPKPYLVQWRL